MQIMSFSSYDFLNLKLKIFEKNKIMKKTELTFFLKLANKTSLRNEVFCFLKKNS